MGYIAFATLSVAHQDSELTLLLNDRSVDINIMGNVISLADRALSAVK
jgi:hypothetical protein